LDGNLDKIRDLIARQRPGWSLERPFYVSPEIYEFERRGWLGRQWYVLGHSSEVNEPNSYIIRELLGESLIMVRDQAGVLRGFYNVCRHRGSRICDSDGRGARLVCPYHAWAYGTDGALLAAPAMAEGTDFGELGLRSIGLREIGGVIFGSLKADPGELDDVAGQAEAMLAHHGIPGARIGARRSYPTRGNWKLVMENFLECYHCFPSHPEYCSVMAWVKVMARDAAPDEAAEWQGEVDRWAREEADRNSPVPVPGLEMMDSDSAFMVFRGPIGNGFKTATLDGEPVAPLMGRMSHFDGGVSNLAFDPFIYINSTSDHARMMQFLPVGPEKTDVIITWLVNGDAPDDQVDIERMIWLWDETTIQDKAIIERNAAGVRSLAYEPGPYSNLEAHSAKYIQNYLQELLAETPTQSPP
jgi:Rieske 2Fe-2S family protein